MSLFAKWHWNEVQDIETRFIFEASDLNNFNVHQKCSFNPKIILLFISLVLALVACLITNVSTDFQFCCWMR